MFNRSKRIYSIFVAFFLISFYQVYGKEISVKSQLDLDLLNFKLIDSIESGNDSIIVELYPGTYYYSQSMISLKVLNEALSLSMVGKDVILMPKLSDAKVFNPSSVQFRGKKWTNLWSEVVQSSELISVVDESQKLCRIKIADSITAKNGDYIQISQWYKTLRYKVLSSDNEYIYFIAHDLSYISNKSTWSVNYDYIYAKRYPRYRVFSVESNNDIKQSSVTTFLDISQTKIKNIAIKGIAFIGSAGSIYSKGVINLSNVSAKEINIENSSFIGCLSSCIRLENTSNLKVKDCVFNGNYTTCISIGTNCNNASIEGNLFEDNGKEWNNSHVVLAKGANFMISDNVFRDFCYGAIGVGIWYKHKKNTEVSGVITNNEICYTDTYYKNYHKHTLMDSGAIYLWTQMDDVAIRHNYIHDISGIVDNRGIFCDDGTKNVKISENLILRISNCYCIDLREAFYVAEFVPDFNTGNHCFNNLIDGENRFFIKDKSCKENNNIKIGEPGWEALKKYIEWSKL